MCRVCRENFHKAKDEREWMKFGVCVKLHPRVSDWLFFSKNQNNAFENRISKHFCSNCPVFEQCLTSELYINKQNPATCYGIYASVPANIRYEFVETNTIDDTDCDFQNKVDELVEDVRNVKCDCVYCNEYSDVYNTPLDEIAEDMNSKTRAEFVKKTTTHRRRAHNRLKYWENKKERERENREQAIKEGKKIADRVLNITKNTGKP